MLLIPERDAPVREPVAADGASRLATIAAVSGALAFAMFHTEPYYRFTIDQTAGSSIEAILQARSSTWRAGYRCTAAPTLQRSGAFSATNAVISHQLDRQLGPPDH